MVRHRPAREERGLTLVELLVVLVIVGILAGIAAALFVAQRTKAQDAEAKATATTAVQALTVWQQEQHTYAGAGRAELARIEPTLARARGLVVDGTAGSYEVTVASAAGGTFTIARRGGGAERTCSDRGRGACPDDGVW